MAEVQAFRGYRFDLARVGNLSDVIAPPYDVIDPALQQAFYDRSPFNTVRLILNQETPADSANNNRYSRAAQTLRDWINDGVLVQDSARCLYVYQQEFEVEGKKYTRKGFMARVRLEKFGSGRIYPHEETMSGPKADRLRLFHATNMNLSQIFGLFPDEAGEVQQSIDTAIVRALPIQATDHLGVVSRLWPITDQGVIHTVARLMSPKPVFIADGHHRYETALRYLDEKQAAGEVAGTEAPPNFVLMMLVSMHDPGLVILPTHRLVSNLGAMTAGQLREALGKHFELESIGHGPEAARQAWEWIEADGTQGLLGFGTVADGMWMTGRFRSPEMMAELAQEHSPSWQGLAVSVLQRVVLEKLLPDAGQKEPKCQYVHLLNEVNEAVAARTCDLAVLVPPATMQHVEQIAGNLEKMPPKSTYFYPKLLSGLVFHSLKAN
ncbi:MAG: DUF1015 domain-containing protein [Planctomycetes bacterium]|nr:DUF1015 domain-containing protein [Planctomycetota bacterium]